MQLGSQALLQLAGAAGWGHFGLALPFAVSGSCCDMARLLLAVARPSSGVQLLLQGCSIGICMGHTPAVAVAVTTTAIQFVALGRSHVGWHRVRFTIWVTHVQLLA